MKVTAVLNSKTDALGRHTVYIRVNIGKDRTHRATTIKVLKSQFSKGKVVNHPSAKLYNIKIKDAILQAEAAALRSEKEYPDSDFRAFLEKTLALWKGDKKGKSLYQLRHYTEQFLDYIGEILLSKITLQHLNGYKALLNEKYKGSNNVWKAFVKIRTVYRQALRENIIKEDAFKQFKPPVWKPPRKKYLTEAQVTQLEQYVLSPSCPVGDRFYGVWFLIGCYTGLRYSDMRQFDRKEHIKGGMLTLHTVKTGEIVSVPLNDTLKNLLEQVQYKPMLRPNNEFNKRLKEIAAAAKIPKVTVHTARHTFGVRCAGRDLSLRSTADLMGHKDIKSTEVYYKITSEKRKQDFNKLF